jgi:hypothetical protein
MGEDLREASRQALGGGVLRIELERTRREPVSVGLISSLECHPSQADHGDSIAGVSFEDLCEETLGLIDHPHGQLALRLEEDLDHR